MRGSAPRTEGSWAQREASTGASVFSTKDSRRLDTGKLCRSTRWDSNSGIGLGHESCPKRSHPGGAIQEMVGSPI